MPGFEGGSAHLGGKKLGVFREEELGILKKGGSMLYKRQGEGTLLGGGSMARVIFSISFWCIIWLVMAGA